MAIFHPDHDELHGFTVCLACKDGVTYIGRWDHEEGGLILLNDAAHHQDGDEGQSTTEFVSHSALWGVRPNHPRCMVQREDVISIRKLGEIATEVRGW